MKITNVEEENLHIFWMTSGISMKFSGNMWNNHRKRTSLLLWKVNFWKSHRRRGSDWHPPTFQGFIQALSPTFVFPEGLSLMAIGHNPTCVKHVGSFSWRFRNKLLQWSRDQALESFGYFSDPRFLNSLSMHRSVT